jgi:WD40 repeat protein
VRRWPTDPAFRPVLALSADGRTLALAGIAERGSLLRLCETATGKDRFLFRGRPHLDAPGCLAFAPDGKGLATASVLGEFSVWDLAAGKVSRPEGAAPRAVGGRLLYAHGQGLFAGHLHQTALWDLAAGKPVRAFPGSTPWDLPPDGKYLATLAVAEPPVSWDLPRTGRGGFWLRGVPVAGGKVRWRTPLASLVSEAAFFSADGRSVVVGRAHANSIEVLDADSGKRRTTWKWDGRYGVPVAVASGERKRFAVLSLGKVYLHELAPGKPAVVCADAEPLSDEETSLSFSPDGRFLAAAVADAGEKGSATTVWEAATGKVRQRFRGRALGWIPDGTTLLLDGASAAEVRDVETGICVRSFPRLGARSRVAFSPDGRYLALTSDRVLRWEFGLGEYTAPRPVRLVDLATGATARTFKGDEKAIYWVGFGPDGRTFATASLDGTALVWDVTGRLRGGRVAPAGQSPKEFAECWEALKSAEAPRIHRAVWALVAAGDAAVPRLRGRLAPAAPFDPGRLPKVLAKLDSKSFKERERAAGSLLELDPPRSALEEVLTANKVSPEVRRRLKDLLGRLADPVAWPERRRAWRALQVLEQIGTPPARALLGELARGAPGAHLTEQARHALRRLTLLRAAGR